MVVVVVVVVTVAGRRLMMVGEADDELGTGATVGDDD